MCAGPGGGGQERARQGQEVLMWVCSGGHSIDTSCRLLADYFCFAPGEGSTTRRVAGIKLALLSPAPWLLLREAAAEEYATGRHVLNQLQHLHWLICCCALSNPQLEASGLPGLSRVLLQIQQQGEKGTAGMYSSSS